MGAAGRCDKVVPSARVNLGWDLSRPKAPARKEPHVQSPQPFRILTVCTGNICRSPVAERLLQAGLNQVSPGSFEGRTGAKRAMVGEPIQPLSAQIISTFRGTPEDFAAR